MHWKTLGQLGCLTLRLLAGLAVLTPAGVVKAEDSDASAGVSGLRVSGFGSVGLSHVSGPEGWGFRRDVSQPAVPNAWRSDVDSRLGLQLNYSLGSQLELVAQGIARKRGRYASDIDALEWAYAAYRPDADWTLRLGRVNFDALLMADYRNVGYGYMPARPATELYGRLPTTLDGGDLARSWIDGDAHWRVKLMAGSTRIGDLHAERTNRVRSARGAMVSREEGGLLLRAGMVRGRMVLDLESIQPALSGLGELTALPVPAVAEQARALHSRLGINGISATFKEVGLRYEVGNWQWNAEFVRASAAPLTVENTAYVNVGRSFGDWTPYVGYAIGHNKLAVLDQPVWLAQLAPVIGPLAAAQAQGLGSAVVTALNLQRMHQSTFSLGVRWDFHPQAALKLQWERVRIDPYGASLWTGVDGRRAGATVTTAVVDFIF